MVLFNIYIFPLFQINLLLASQPSKPSKLMYVATSTPNASTPSTPSIPLSAIASNGQQTLDTSMTASLDDSIPHVLSLKDPQAVATVTEAAVTVTDSSAGDSTPTEPTQPTKQKELVLDKVAKD